MPKICYIPKNFNSQSMLLIIKANAKIESFQSQGYDLTVRQLYYQFVKEDWLPDKWADPDTGSTNNQKSYGKFAMLINNARMAGLIDWNAITDRTRNLQSNSHWSNPGSIIRSAAYSYALDKWENQDYRLEVWIEKDALTGIIESPCSNFDVPYFACKGYNSQSEMWRAGHKRLMSYIDQGQIPVIIHLGDHDPSGIDMTRDIQERLELFSGNRIKIERIALSMDQIQEFNPPPNPAKITDTRAKGYIAEFGRESWELDALDPDILSSLVRDTIARFVDKDLYDETCSKEEEQRSLIEKVASNWEDIIENINT